ncbi:hypothetical protein CDAR_190321 [Caerostris darwini]|uniref:Uncharacterized protein n=1 Tax=Caerostris darwini TaxID=1538125 RepID=A0AAV4MN72_9ARAC|nr:hypothetical protein CDAR_190321 [Caerostris darwini]
MFLTKSGRGATSSGRERGKEKLVVDEGLKILWVEGLAVHPIHLSDVISGCPLLALRHLSVRLVLGIYGAKVGDIPDKAVVQGVKGCTEHNKKVIWGDTVSNNISPAIYQDLKNVVSPKWFHTFPSTEWPRGDFFWEGNSEGKAGGGG